MSYLRINRTEIIILLSLFIIIYLSNYVFLVYIILLNILLILAHYKALYRFKKIGILWLIFPFGICLTNIFNSHYNSHWVRPMLTFFLIIFLLTVSSNIVSEKSIKYSVNSLNGIGYFMASSVILSRIFPNFFIQYIYRYFSVLTKETLFNQVSNSVYFSGVAPSPAYAATIISIPLIYHLIREKKTWYNIFFLFLALIVTGKRSHIIFVILTIFCNYLFISPVSKKGKHFVNGGITLLITCIISYIFLLIIPVDSFGAVGRLAQSIKLFVSSSSTGNLNLASAGRFDNYVAAWQYFLMSPYIGIGWQMFSIKFFNNYLGSHQANVHNIYLQLLCDSGIIGFLSFIFPASYTLRSSIKKNNLDDSNLLLRFGISLQFFFLLYGLTETSFDASLIYCMYFYGIFISINSKKSLMETNL